MSDGHAASSLRPITAAPGYFAQHMKCASLRDDSDEKPLHRVDT